MEKEPEKDPCRLVDQVFAAHVQFYVLLFFLEFHFDKFKPRTTKIQCPEIFALQVASTMKMTIEFDGDHVRLRLPL